MEAIIDKPRIVKSAMLPLKEARILPIGDIQLGGVVDAERLAKYLAWGMENDFRFLGTGDYVDFASPSNRMVMQSAAPHLYDIVNQMTEDGANKLLDGLKEILKETRGRWIGLLNGHHYWQYRDGSTTTSRLAEFLDCPELGDCGLIGIPFTRGKETLTAWIWCHHGAGGGQLASAPLNKLEQHTKTRFAHVYIMAHQHKIAAAPIPWLVPYIDENGQPAEHGTKRYLVAVGGFLKGYEIGTKDLAGHPAGNYIEQKMLGPVALGSAAIYLRPVFEENRIDINVSV